jgi:N-terminal domain on NACHT_NTPase and P-loop NTPases
MSGLEVLGGISAVIAIIDGSVKVWESVRKDLRSSATFETVGNRLPILRDILQTCHEHFEPIKISGRPPSRPLDSVQNEPQEVEDRASWRSQSSQHCCCAQGGACFRGSTGLVIVVGSLL